MQIIYMGELCKYWGFMNDAVVIITYTIISTSTVTSSSNQMDYFPHRIIDLCSVCEALVVYFLSFLSLTRAHTHTHTHWSCLLFFHFLLSLSLSPFLFLTFSLSFSVSHFLSLLFFLSHTLSHLFSHTFSLSFIPTLYFFLSFFPKNLLNWNLFCNMYFYPTYATDSIFITWGMLLFYDTTIHQTCYIETCFAICTFWNCAFVHLWFISIILYHAAW